MHIAETREQALEDVEYGIDAWFDYLQHTAAAPQFHPLGETLEERIDWVNESGVGVIGTPEDAVRKIDELHKQSNGGFGCLPDDGPRVGPARRRRPPLRAVRRPRDAALPGLGRPHAGLRALRPGPWDELNTKQADALAAWTDKHAKERANKS